MPNIITEQIRCLHLAPWAELEDRAESIKTHIEQRRLRGEINEESAVQLVFDVNNERARIKRARSERGEDNPIPFQELLVVDGPFKGAAFAHTTNHFYTAQLHLPSLMRPDVFPGRIAPMDRILYRLRRSTGGRLVWSCVSD